MSIASTQLTNSAAQWSRHSAHGSADASPGRDLYLDLLKRVLLRDGFEESVIAVNPADGKWHWWASKIIRGLLGPMGMDVVRRVSRDRMRTGENQGWPVNAETMVSRKRLDNVEFCVREVVQQKIPGDLIETGVWRGGTSIFLRALLEAYGDTDRRVWVADSFEGLPAPNADAYPADAGDRHSTYDHLAVSLEDVKANFARYGLLDDRVEFLKGWFRDTLPHVPAERFAVVRLDGDMYESTMDGLVHLYPKLSPGGFLIVDDYRILRSCEQAVQDYRQKHRIEDEIHVVDSCAVYWQKSQA